MSPLEAKKIIESLAHGIDPETGEILPTQNSFNSPQVIRALFVAGEALDSAAKRAERNSLLPGNAGHSWSDDEDKELLALFDSGTPVKEIAVKHGRTQGAIVSRLIRLGKIKDRAEVYANAQPSNPSDAAHHQEGTQ
ncbi:MAG: hypothetical protein ACXV7J_04855 [Methylomonas sp.]